MAMAALLGARPGGWFTASGIVDEPLVAMHEAALDALGPGDSIFRARLLAGLAVQLVFANDRAFRVRLCEEALAMAKRIGDGLTLTQVLAARLIALWDPTTLDERVAVARDLSTMGRELDNV